MKKLSFYYFLFFCMSIFSQNFFYQTSSNSSANNNVSHLGNISLGTTYNSIIDPWRLGEVRLLELYKPNGNVSMRLGNNYGKLSIATAGSNGAFFPAATTGDIIIKKHTANKVFFSLNNTSNDGNHSFVFGDNLNLKTLTILNNGRVGIGTDSPDAELAVNGTIHSKKVNVDLNGWSDFVFDIDYELPSLEEVENHIKEEGHLKDIPSEEDVLKNGIDLGEMDSKLLQKIEELTLYIIEQEKMINKMNAQIDVLIEKVKPQ